MTNPPKPPVLELLATNVREICRIATVLVGAGDYSLHIGKRLEWMRQRLDVLGTNMAPQPLSPASMETFRSISVNVRQLPPAPGAPTDIMDIGLDVEGDAGETVAVLQLDGVPAGWATRDRLKGLAHVTTMLKRQLNALADGPVVMALPMLRLLELVRDLDETAVSPTAIGLVTVLAGGQPSSVEAMAMQISGLADCDMPRSAESEVVLSGPAREIINESGLWLSDAIEAVTLGEAVVVDALPVAASAPVPFARARILEREFDVAEVDATNRLWVRPAGSVEDWVPLDNGASDGWTKIAVEIMERNFDIGAEFAQMHLIRRRELPTEEIAEAYELHGTVWWLREGESGLEARLHGGNWQALAAPGDEVPHRRLAYDALLKIDAGSGERLAGHVRDWAHRMAHSVQVSPYMGLAAE